jgi:hypothetical protein
MLALLLTPAAHAFCGTYLGPAGSSFENGTSQVVIAREGTQTTLTLAVDVQGDAADFALVIPVPELLDEADVSLPDGQLFADLDAYSAPREVAYTCAELGGDTGVGYDMAGSADSGGAGPMEEDATGVTVEANFTEGSYEFVVLSATGGDGLVTWLTDNGYTMPETTAPVLQEYIDAGQYFLGAKVALGAVPSAIATLEPIQLRYTSEVWTLPIRIGTTVSPGEQDVVIYALTPGDEGRVSISNFAEASVVDECMLAEGEDAGEHYQAELKRAFEGDNLWITEYAWWTQGCDPCSTQPPTGEILASAGATWESAEDTGYWGTSTFITRLRLRYTPAEATQDVQLYASGITETDQIRYIQYLDMGECAVGAEAPGPLCTEAPDDGGCSGCATGGGTPAALALLGALALARRNALRS